MRFLAEKFIALSLPAVSLIFLVAASCGGNSELALFGTDAKPLVERHFDVINRLASLSVEYLQIAQGLPLNERQGLLSEFSELTTGIADELTQVTSDWGNLQPPKEARQFHSVGYEMMQLRARSALSLRSYFNILVRTGRLDDQLLNTAEEQLAEADRLSIDFFCRG